VRQAEGGSVCSPIAKDCVASTLTFHALNVEFFYSVMSKQAVLTFNTLPFNNTTYDVIIGHNTIIQHALLHDTFANRFKPKPVSAKPAMIASTHASIINADVREVNITTFEQGEHTRLDDPVHGFPRIKVMPKYQN
jgi:hypothetical protein